MSPHGRKDFDVRVSAISVVMSGVWVISQKVDVSPHGSKDFDARVSAISVATAGISIAGSSSMVKNWTG